MATTCDACGHRENEVKSGSGIAEQGTRIELRLTDPSDLTRDLLKVCVTDWIICCVFFCHFHSWKVAFLGESISYQSWWPKKDLVQAGSPDVPKQDSRLITPQM